MYQVSSSTRDVSVMRRSYHKQLYIDPFTRYYNKSQKLGNKEWDKTRGRGKIEDVRTRNRHNHIRSPVYSNICVYFTVQKLFDRWTMKIFRIRQPCRLHVVSIRAIEMTGDARNAHREPRRPEYYFFKVVCADYAGKSSSTSSPRPRIRVLTPTQIRTETERWCLDANSIARGYGASANNLCGVEKFHKSCGYVCITSRFYHRPTATVATIRYLNYKRRWRSAQRRGTPGLRAIEKPLRNFFPS